MKQLSILLFVFLVGCTSQKFNFDGKRIYFDGYTDSLRIELPDTLIRIGLPRSRTVSYSSPVWIKDKDEFLLNVNEKVLNQNSYNYRLCLYDLNGNMIKTVYKEEPGYIIDYMPSPNDSLILIRRYLYSDWNSAKPADTTWYEHNVDYLLFNMNDSSIQKIISFESGLNIYDFVETNWSPDSKNVLIERRPKQSVSNRLYHEWYIYNLASRDTTYIDGGENFVFSPNNKNIVSYLKDNQIWFYFIDSKRHQRFCRVPGEHRIISFRWTLQGDELLIHCCKKSLLLRPFGSNISLRGYDLLVSADGTTTKKGKGWYMIDTWKK